MIYYKAEYACAFQLAALDNGRYAPLMVIVSFELSSCVVTADWGRRVCAIRD